MPSFGTERLNPKGVKPFFMPEHNQAYLATVYTVMYIAIFIELAGVQANEKNRYQTPSCKFSAFLHYFVFHSALSNNLPDSAGLFN